MKMDSKLYGSAQKTGGDDGGLGLSASDEGCSDNTCLLQERRFITYPMDQYSKEYSLSLIFDYGTKRQIEVRFESAGGQKQEVARCPGLHYVYSVFHLKEHELNV